MMSLLSGQYAYKIYRQSYKHSQALEALVKNLKISFIGRWDPLIQKAKAYRR